MTTVWRALLATGGGLLQFTGCPQIDPRTLSDAGVFATATACSCHYYLYGSYPHTTPSGTPTPTGTWGPPPATRTPTPTRPPAGCNFCTMPPGPTRPRPDWPPPIQTCTPRPDAPTLVPALTLEALLFPTFPLTTPLLAAIGTTAPVALSAAEGEAWPGNVATDPHTGHPLVVWSQFNLDPGGI